MNAEHSIPSRRDETIREGLDKLGWEWEVMQRNVRGCTEEVCRLCHYGCQLGAKQSTLKTWVQDAHDAGRPHPRPDPRRSGCLIEGGAARGVEAAHRRRARGDRARRARSVSACGSLHTPVLLARSGVSSKALGKHLRLHPVLVIWGQFDEEVRPWEGMLASTYSDQDADMDGDGYGVKYEHVATPPSILHVVRALARRAPARRADAGAAVHGRARGAACATTAWARSAPAGDGEPVVRYKLTTERRRAHAPRRARRRAGGRGDGRAAGLLLALRAGSPTSRARAATWTSFMRAAPTPAAGAPDRRRWSRSTSWAAPAWAARRSTRCAIPTGEVWSTPGLYVIDGAAFPTASGVNPMVTIEALSHMNARGLAAKLGAVA